MVEDREEDAQYFVRELWAKLQDNEVVYLIYEAEYEIEDEQHSSDTGYVGQADRAEAIHFVAEWSKECQADFEPDTVAFEWKDWSSVEKNEETVEIPPEKLVREWLGGSSTDEGSDAPEVAEP